MNRSETRSAVEISRFVKRLLLGFNVLKSDESQPTARKNFFMDENLVKIIVIAVQLHNYCAQFRTHVRTIQYCNIRTSTNSVVQRTFFLYMLGDLGSSPHRVTGTFISVTVLKVRIPYRIDTGSKAAEAWIWRRIYSNSVAFSPQANYTDGPSDRRLSAKFVPTFADRGCRVVSATDPNCR
jgi:hypothetical protein